MTTFSFLTLLAAMLMGLLAPRKHPLRVIALLIAWGSLSGIRRGDPSLGLNVAAYLGFGVTFAAALSSLSLSFFREHRAFAIAALGTLLSLGLLAVAMWVGVQEIVVGAFGLTVLLFASMVIATIRGKEQGKNPTYIDGTGIR